MSDTSEKLIADFLKWEKARRRPEGHFDSPVRGWGWPIPDIATSTPATIWLASNVAGQVVRVRDGVPMVDVIEASNDDELNTLRSSLIRNMSLADRNGFSGVVLFVQGDFLRYAARCITLNYSVTDDELGRLLSGTAWQPEIAKHIFGGDRVLDQVNAVAPSLLAPDPDQGPIDADQPHAFPALATTFLRRILNRVIGASNV